MSPTTREVEAARVERMRREAAARAAQQPAPKSAQARRTARAEEAHRAATARNRWRCKVEGCPDLDVWHAPLYDTREAALAESRRHYLTNHYQPPRATDRPAPRPVR
jgi:hypothetical protein